MNHSVIARIPARRIYLSAVAVLLALLAGLLVVTQPARANTYNVTNTSNSGSGSLRQAITDAYNNPGADIITFDAAINGTPIVLSGAAGEDANASGDLDILDGGDLTIQGNGATNTIIDGGGIDRVFHVCPGGGCANTVTLSDVIIRNGSVTGSGGGILNYGTLNVLSSTIGGLPSNGNTAEWGGGIYNAAGTTTVDGSTVSYNKANYGGGIYNDMPSTLNVENNTIIDGNTATTDGGGIYNSAGVVAVNDSIVRTNDATDGGGIYNWDEGALNITNSTIGGPVALNANTATDEGGGIYNIGTTTVDGSTVSANTANYGGGIYNLATLNVQNGSTVGGAGAGNVATPLGGGIYNAAGTTTVDNSTVSANDAFNGSGVYNWATLNIQNGSTIGGAGAGNGPTNEGGGIYNQIGANTTVDGSTVSANTANHGGGILSQGTLNVQNGSTIGGAGVGNTADTNGGGIYILAGTTTVDGSTVSANTADYGGGIYNWEDGTLNIQSSSTIGGVAGAGLGNEATTDGGGIYNKGTTTVDSSTVSANSAFYGGGINNYGMLYIQNSSTIGGSAMGNTAGWVGGGIINLDGMTTVDNSTISANTANTGGGVYNMAVLNVQNGSTIGGAGAGNTATGNGGGIYNGDPGTAMVTGSRFLYNTATNGGGVFNDRNGPSVTSVTGSCIVGNTTSAFYNNQPATQAAPSNWWGAATGPNTPGADTTVGSVTTSGYLTAPILGCGYNAQWTFEGRVYEGDIGDEARPLVGVNVAVYGANNPYPDAGTLIRNTWTDSIGWYGLTVYETDGLFDYYSIRASDLNDYVSVGGSTVDGVVRTENWIEYAAPLTGKTLTGNKFWDRAPVLSGRVFTGTAGDESTPLDSVKVNLYCSNNPYPDLGSALSSTVTDVSGWYGLSTYRLNGLCDFYHIVESDPLSYFSAGVSSVGGVVREANWIEYAAPYATKTLTGNKFWDDTNMVYLPLSMKN